MLAELKLDKIHIARYSPRPNTVSERRMDDDVPDAEAIMIAFNREIHRMQVDGTYNDMLGLEWVRIDVLWSIIEPARDVYDWSVYDALVDRLETRGLRTYAGMGATPAWATSGPAFSGVPDDPDQWREFCFLVAARYAGSGRSGSSSRSVPSSSASAPNICAA